VQKALLDAFPGVRIEVSPYTEGLECAEPVV